MKLLVPVVGIVFSIGACCCGDMGGLEERMEELQGAAVEDAEAVPVEAPSAEAAAVPSAATPAGTVDGACGRYRDWGLKVPAGFTVLACSDAPDAAGIVLQGAGSPTEACKVVRAWAEGTGATLAMENAMGGTSSLIFEKENAQITVACTDVTGTTTISIALSASEAVEGD